MVTGASGGLGGAVVDAFLTAGATVAGAARSVSPRDDSDRFVAVPADLTSAFGAQDAVDQTLSKARGLDVLVHVMGGFAGGQPVHATDDATWDRMMSLNLRSAFLIARAVLPHMRRARYGRIVAVGSRVAVEPAAGLSAYGVSKAGLNALVKTIALEARDHGITANVVMPGVIDTAANRNAMPDADFSQWVAPEKIAQQVLWLCSEAASDTSGALIPVYGRS